MRSGPSLTCPDVSLASRACNRPRNAAEPIAAQSIALVPAGSSCSGAYTLRYQIATRRNTARARENGASATLLDRNAAQRNVEQRNTAHRFRPSKSTLKQSVRYTVQSELIAFTPAGARYNRAYHTPPKRNAAKRNATQPIVAQRTTFAPARTG